jgi:hypothetical protein
MQNCARRSDGLTIPPEEIDAAALSKAFRILDAKIAVIAWHLDSMRDRGAFGRRCGGWLQICCMNSQSIRPDARPAAICDRREL